MENQPSTWMLQAQTPCSCYKGNVFSVEPITCAAEHTFPHLSKVQEKARRRTSIRKCWLLSRVRLFGTPWTVAHQASLSMRFSRQEYWSGLPRPVPGDLPNPGIEPRSPALQTHSLLSQPPGKPFYLEKQCVKYPVSPRIPSASYWNSRFKVPTPPQPAFALPSPTPLLWQLKSKNRKICSSNLGLTGPLQGFSLTQKGA